MHYTWEQTNAIGIIADETEELRALAESSSEKTPSKEQVIELVCRIESAIITLKAEASLADEPEDPPYQIYRVPIFVECYGRDQDEARETVLEALNGIDSWNELLDQERIEAIDPEVGPILTVCVGNIEEVVLVPEEPYTTINTIPGDIGARDSF